MSKLPPILKVLAIVVVSRFSIFAWGTLKFDFSKRAEMGFTDIWNRWDAVHYLTIAEFWYDSPAIDFSRKEFISRFPPLYPLLIKIASLNDSRLIPLMGLTVSLIAFFFACYVLYKLVVLETSSDRTAIKAVILINIFPASYFANTSYSESLFLLLTISYFYLLRTQQNLLWVSLLAGLAILTRSIGLAIVPVHLFSCWRAHRENGFSWKYPVYSLLPFIFFGGFIFYQQIFLQLPGYNLANNQPILQTLSPIPFRESYQVIGRILQNPELLFDSSFMLTQGWTQVFILASSAIILLGLRRLPLVYAIYSISYLLILSPLTWFIAGPRYVFGLFPIFMFLARLKSRLAVFLLFTISLVLLLYFSSIFTSGRYAF